MKLNHRKIKAELQKRGIRTSDLAKKWGITWHLAYYAKTKGGMSYLDRFAKMFNMKKVDLLTGLRRK